MVTSSPALRSIVPGTRALHALDIALAVWVLAWIGLGVAVGVELGNLSSLSRTAVVDGRAVEAVGRSLGALSGVPLVGGSLSGVSHQVQLAGASAVNGGMTSESSVHALSVLLAIAVAVLPSVPVFGFYLPVRLELRREAQALSQAVRQYGAEPAFQTFLARRAIDSLGYHRLRDLAVLPWSESATGADRVQLAAVELRRLGIDPIVLERPVAGDGRIRERSPI